MNNLGGQLFMQGDREGALALFKEVVELQQRILGLEDRRTLVSMNNLANVYWYMKRFTEVRKLYRRDAVMAAAHPRPGQY